MRSTFKHSEKSLINLWILRGALWLGVLALAPAASAQVIVDGQSAGTVLHGRPVQRTYAQVYPPQNRARLITKQSVMDAGGTMPAVQYARYVQEPLAPPPGAYTSPPPGMISVEEFRVDPYSTRRYRNTYYYSPTYWSGWHYYGPYYWYGSYGWSFRPSQYRFNYCKPVPRHCGSSSWRGGSFLRYSSSCGLSLRINF